MTRLSGSARPIRLLQPASSLAWQPPPARPAREGPPPDPSVGVRPRRQPDPPLRVRRPTRLSGSSVCLPSVFPPHLLLISFVLHPPPSLPLPSSLPSPTPFLLALPSSFPLFRGCANYTWQVKKIYPPKGYDRRRRGRVSRVWDIRTC